MTEHKEEEIKSSKKRKRLTLTEKKQLVDKFKSEKFEDSSKRKKEDKKRRVSKQKFCEVNGIKSQVILSDWLTMDSLGHLESWNGRNNLSKTNFVESEVDVLQFINEGLCNRVGEYIKIKKLLVKYGAYAAQNISSETMIGFFSGEYCGGNDTYSNHKHGITKTHVIDAGDFLSCHARYVKK